MSRAVVDHILEQIKRLPVEERRLLDEMLAEQEGQEWREEAAKAREEAQRRGLDQAVIDQAVRGCRLF
jgi:hypothetical protein